MQNFETDGNERIEGLVVVKPIVYGSIARRLHSGLDIGAHTHEWTIYLRPYENEDMSHFVKKVVIKLHDSFTESNRIFTKPPYEVTETGWGEFETIIKIFFNCPKERPVVLRHYLKLFNRTIAEDVNSVIVSESYDEIVFQNPTQSMAKLLLSPKIGKGFVQHSQDYERKKAETLKAILAAKEKMKTEISNIRARVVLGKKELDKRIKEY